MLAHIDQGNIADYFPMLSCSWAVNQHCTGKKFSCAMLAQTDQDNVIQVIFLQTHVCALCASIGQVFFFCAMLSQTYLDNTDQTIFLCNVVPVWSIQHCKGYFLHKSCLLAMGQRFTGKNLVQCWPRDSRQQCTGKILFHFVSTLLGQHGTGKNLVRCCPRDSRQYCPGKNPVQCRLNITFGNFYFGLINFSIVKGCCEKRTRLYGTQSSY